MVVRYLRCRCEQKTNRYGTRVYAHRGDDRFVLLLIVSLSTQQALTTSFEIKDSVTSINERHHEARQTLSRMSREIRMAFIRAEVPEQFREEKPAVMTRFLEKKMSLFLPQHHIKDPSESTGVDQCEIAIFSRMTPIAPTEARHSYRRESTIIDNRPKHGGYITKS